MLKDFNITVTFEAFHNVSKLCKTVSDEDSNEDYWFSWSLFDNTYKSDVFQKDQNGPKRFKDSVELNCFHRDDSSNSLPSQIINAFPLRVFLCKENSVVGVANMFPFKPDPSQGEKLSITHPYEISEWVDLIPLSPLEETSDYFKDGLSSSLKISVQISMTKGESVEEKGEENEYGDEEFESDVEQEKKEENIEETEKKADEKCEKNENIERKLRFDEENMRREDDLIEAEQTLRHFRVNIHMHSILGLKRPAHVALQFSYPFLGATAPVRTHPMWVLAHTETKVDGGAVSYECALTRQRLRDILSSHPLKITALSRSHLGNNLLGELFVDLAAVCFTEPHSYRCPMTGKTFKQLSEYVKHRQVLLALMAAGRIDTAPPKDPVIIRAVDSYLVFASPKLETHSAKSEGGKSLPNYIVPLAEGSKLRVVVIIEDIGRVGSETAIAVRPGYKMHNGGLYGLGGELPDQLISKEIESGIVGENDENIDTAHVLRDPLHRQTLSPLQRAELNRLKVDWEGWRRMVETQWRNSMHEKEMQLRENLEQENSKKLIQQADDLKRAQQETAKLEVRLRSHIEAVERQKQQLVLREEQMQMRLAQKSSELQLLQRRVREEAKASIDEAIHKADGLQQQLSSTQDALRLMEKRAKDAERDFDSYRSQWRNKPESVLREETARLRAQLGECRAEVERERRLRSEAELEKEHFRSQMHRLAQALKREREKSSHIARQEMEQLRLEFLAREERYILDGDRNELRGIREQLGFLKRQTLNQQIPSRQTPKPILNKRESSKSQINHNFIQEQSLWEKSPVIESKSHDSSPSYSEKSDDEYKNPAFLPFPMDPAEEMNKTRIDHESKKILNLRNEITELLESQLYDVEDPVIIEIRRQLQDAERQLSEMRIE